MLLKKLINRNRKSHKKLRSVIFKIIAIVVITAVTLSQPLGPIIMGPLVFVDAMLGIKTLVDIVGLAKESAHNKKVDRRREAKAEKRMAAKQQDMQEEQVAEEAYEQNDVQDKAKDAEQSTPVDKKVEEVKPSTEEAQPTTEEAQPSAEEKKTNELESSGKYSTLQNRDITLKQEADSKQEVSEMEM